MALTRNDESQQMLDDLLLLGYQITITDEGAITARDVAGGETLEGHTDSGRIEWSNRSLMFKVRQRAYIATLRAYIQRQVQSRTQGHFPHEIDC